MMRSTDDRDQLLYVLLEDYDKPESMRSRTAMRGAAAILSRWPGHVMWVLWVVSAVTIIVCTLLAVCWVVMAPEVDETRAERSCQAEGHAAEIMHLDALEISDSDDSTFFIHMSSDSNNAVLPLSGCALESFLRKIPGSIYFIDIGGGKPENSSLSQIHAKFSNFKRAVFFKMDDFFKETIFEGLIKENPALATFFAKILMSWNFKGMIIDPNFLTLSAYDRNKIVKHTADDIIIGISDGSVAFIDSKQWCHSFIFEVMKLISGHNNTSDFSSEAEIIDSAFRSYCRGKADCHGVKIVSSPVLCSPETITNKCVFTNLHSNNSRLLDSVLRKTCPSFSKTMKS